MDIFNQCLCMIRDKQDMSHASCEVVLLKCILSALCFPQSSIKSVCQMVLLNWWCLQACIFYVCCKHTSDSKENWCKTWFAWFWNFEIIVHPACFLCDIHILTVIFHETGAFFSFLTEIEATPRSCISFSMLLWSKLEQCIKTL